MKNQSVTVPQGKRPLSVLQVTARFFPYLGGVETHVWEVSHRLATRGADVTVLTTDRSRKLIPDETVDGIRIIRVPAYPAERDYYFAPGVYDALRHGHWDLVHVQGSHTLVAPLAMLAAYRSGIPYIVTFHTGGHTSRIRAAARSFQWRLQGPLYAHAKRLIGVSQFEAQQFQRLLHLPSNRFIVIQNGGNLPQVAERKQLAPDEDPLIVSVGRLERYKGHHRLITALPILQMRYPHARVRIIGAGPYEAALRRLVTSLCLDGSADIGAIGPDDRVGMARALAHADLVALLSDYEAHPIAAMEAIALQRPLLVTATSGLQELANRGLATAIPLRCSPAMVASAIVQALEHPHLPPPIELPTWDGCAEQLRAVYLQAVCAIDGAPACEF